MRRSFTDSRMRSPLRTRPSGPPEAASGVTCSTMVPKAVPLMRASEIRTMSLTPCVRELLRDRQIAGLRHRRRRMRAGVLQHQNVLGRDVERGIVDARGEVVERGEHHRPALVLEQLGVGGRALEDGALRRQIAEQRDQPALRLERLVARGDDRAVDIGRRRPRRAARPASRR